MGEYTKEKTVKIGESTRQMLNKSIDLLHKVANKKVVVENAKKEVTELLSTSFSSHTIKFQSLLEQVHEIVDKVDSGKTPLYEAIMQMNKAVMHYPDHIQEDVSKNEEEKKIQSQMNAVLDLKEQLEKSVMQLNELLSCKGFQLKSIIQ